MGVLNDTQLKRLLENNTTGFPDLTLIVRSHRPVPYFLLGDDAFALKDWLMKPLPVRGLSVEQRIYNYRISRARRCVENAFGILSARFRVLHTKGVGRYLKVVRSI